MHTVHTDLCLFGGQILAEDDGWGSSHSNREVCQDWRQDGPALLVPPDTEQMQTRSYCHTVCTVITLPHVRSIA